MVLIRTVLGKDLITDVDEKSVNAFIQLSAKITKLEKISIKIKKVSKKHKLNYKGDIDDTDTS